MAVPSGIPANILPVTNPASPQFYIDWLNGLDSAGNSGAIGQPWKTLSYATNTRLKAGGTNDRKGLGAFINLRTNHYHSTSADTVPALLNCGGSVALTQDAGGSILNPWTIRTAPEDLAGSVGMTNGQPTVVNPSQGAGTQAKISARITPNTGLSFVRWERIDFDAARMDATQFDIVQVSGGQYNQFFYCEVHNNRNGVQFISDNRAGGAQNPNNCGLWGCLIHDGGTDVSGSPHEHGLYVGSGGANGMGADDCWAICCVIYRYTGYGIQWYQMPLRFLIANCTIDEVSYPGAVDPRAGVEVGGDPSKWTRDSLIVNTGISTLAAGANAYAIHLNQSGVGSANKNAAHHNGYFTGGATNEDVAVGDGYPNAIDYLGNNKTADPLYINRALRNYRLNAGSPWKAAGDPNYRPLTDFDGNQFVTTEIGAFALPPPAGVGAPSPVDPNSTSLLLTGAGGRR